MKDATRIKTENESDDLDKAFHTFVTENNVQAILNVLRHSEVQQTKSGLTDEIELSARVGCNPVMQKELRDTFLVLNIEALPSEDLIKMINFVDLLKLEKNVKTDPLLHPILRKRCISYMDHMFDHHTPFVK